MTIRRLTDKERKAARAMAGAKLAGGEHPDDARSSVVFWLVARGSGWKPSEANFRARQIVNAIILAAVESPR